ncbi:MAG TPA: T9SS type A sorting domain-containing protein [candidate division Zixibacteria bacterium]|nr:T9SS type A sorting domain-containing protein [candidate division Zixibacteria bacterium]
MERCFSRDSNLHTYYIYSGEGNMRILQIALLVMLCAGVLLGEIGWCGQIWPNTGTDHTTGTEIAVYFQIWKDGVTDSPGRGEGISAHLYWKSADASDWSIVEMSYLGDVGNNDEYTADIPAPADVGDLLYYCEALDSTDMTTATGTDQNGIPLNEASPGVLHIVDVTAMDVMVTFQVDMSLEDVSGAVTVGGSFNEWSATADTLIDPDDDGIYEISILFPIGSNPSHEFKFVNDGTWEHIPNRVLRIDDSFPMQILPVVFFNDRDPADYTDIDITVNFRVDMSTETVTAPFVGGIVYPLRWGWDSGWEDELMLFDDGEHGDGPAGDGIYGAFITFPAGSYRHVEYKYTTDGTDNEPLPPFENHVFTLGDAPAQTLPIDIFGSLTGIAEAPRPINFDISISPNPFNASTRIRVEIGELRVESEVLRVEVFDIMGRRVEKLFEGKVPSGALELDWNTDAPSGIYMLKVDSGAHTRIAKLFLVR